MLTKKREEAIWPHGNQRGQRLHPKEAGEKNSRGHAGQRQYRTANGLLPPPTIVVSTVPIAIIRSVVMSVVPIPPIIIDLLHLASTVARGKWQNAGLRGNGSGCVDHQDDDKRES